MARFDSLGARLARSRRRKERERNSGVVDALVVDPADPGPSIGATLAAQYPFTAKVIPFPLMAERARS